MTPREIVQQTLDYIATKRAELLEEIGDLERQVRFLDAQERELVQQMAEER